MIHFKVFDHLDCLVKSDELRTGMKQHLEGVETQVLPQKRDSYTERLKLLLYIHAHRRMKRIRNTKKYNKQ